MCGIAGVFHYGTDEPVAQDLVERMTATIAHRGPDGAGAICSGPAGLGHRRLAILDLARGAQPMANAERGIWVTYNGEIYNHPTLRTQLERQGFVYRTHCDTETLLHGYTAWGDDVVHRCQGMFAFAIWDEPRRRMLLARDRLGIKPLLYYDDGRRLFFASEMAALLACPAVPRRIDPQALNFLLTFSYIPAPWTFLAGVRKLLPAERLIADRDGVRTERYWSLPVEPVVASREQAEDTTRRLLREAVERHLLSDVPLGAFLSGGIDSSILVGLLAEIIPGQVRTYTIGFAEYPAYDERHRARLVAEHFGTQHHELLLDRLDLREILPNVIYRFHEPFGDSSAVPAFCVSRLARQEVKVILSGDGADELCAGYNKYTGLYWQSQYARLPAGLRRRVIEPLLRRLPQSRSALGNLVRKADKVVRNTGRPIEDAHYGYMEMLDAPTRQALLAPSLCKAVDIDLPRRFVGDLLRLAPARDPIDRSLLADLANVLPNDMLTKVDTMSMASSLEVRVPFLDHEFVEWMARLDSAYKICGRRTKVILRSAFRDLLPPAVLAWRKHGFELPVGEWFRGPLLPLMRAWLNPEAIERRGLFVPDVPQRLLDEHLSRRACHDWALWTLLVLEAWQALVFDNRPPDEVFAALPASPDATTPGLR